ncbi:flagellar biosynthesis regulator FlaF [Paracoccus sp. (in: a-proteobacteria)]|uniref:flagellar biosynthesis regulator FlaF n=1 Tax=Paracoccus sp. TaxID=267 RepID=UPI0026DFB063|nr:flagellar biosynthesis regulator FlaF [Paracoccus sp. (in: a-proteobacteria)]MDO5647421.1 flagellar biosynthesis regulator FlaF [Paracoccus sp. (in: a-proteobacteria)]
MNAITPLHHAGYKANIVQTPRDTEYDVFSKVTRLLRQADGPNAIQAVHKNNELWTLLATDLATPGNALPDDVKAGLLSLAGFAIRHGHAVLRGEAPVDPLIDINLTVMKGLRGEVAA